MDFCLFFNDNLPTVQTVLSADGSSPLDLSNASGVSFVYNLKSRKGNSTTGNCSIIGSATTGFVQYQFPQGISGGVYYGNYRVSYSGAAGGQMTLPNSQPIIFIINNPN